MPRRSPFSALLTNGSFVALCAVALAWEASLIARTPVPHWTFYAFVFFATWSAYRVHAIARAFAVSRAITIGVLLAAVACLATLPRGDWPTVAVAAAMSWGYSMPLWRAGPRIREFGLAKITVLAGVWTLVTAYLPLHGHGLAAGELAFFLLRRFLFLFALCLAFDVRDHVADAQAGIRTLPVRLGVARSYALIRGTLALFALLLLATPVAFARDPAHHPAAPVTLALLASAALAWLAIEGTRRPGVGRLYYHGAVDGLMAAQSAMVGVAWLASR